MPDLIEFYIKGGPCLSVESSMVPSVGQKISIKKVTYTVVHVVFALDYSETRLKQMRANVDLVKGEG